MRGRQCWCRDFPGVNVDAERQDAATTVAYEQPRRILHYKGISRQLFYPVLPEVRTFRPDCLPIRPGDQGQGGQFLRESTPGIAMRGACSSRGVHGRRPPRYSETFDNPDIAVDHIAPYSKVAAVR